MNCPENTLLLHAYLDGELDELRQAAFKEHVAGCPACSRELESQQTLRAVFQDSALRFQPPARLSTRLQAALDAPDRFGSSVFSAFSPRLAAAVLLLAAFAGGWIAAMALRTQPADDRVALAVTAAHARALLGDHLLDRPSSDRHQVKPWFQGKIDFAPPVKDLTDQGYQLAGGRLDYLDDRPVAALVYRRRQHIINLFLWPAAAGSEVAPVLSSRRGYQLVHWVHAGLNFWAISDLNAEELREFTQVMLRTPSE